MISTERQRSGRPKPKVALRRNERNRSATRTCCNRDTSNKTTARSWESGTPCPQGSATTRATHFLSPSPSRNAFPGSRSGSGLGQEERLLKLSVVSLAGRPRQLDQPLQLRPFCLSIQAKPTPVLVPASHPPPTVNPPASAILPSPTPTPPPPCPPFWSPQQMATLLRQLSPNAKLKPQEPLQNHVYLKAKVQVHHK